MDNNIQIIRPSNTRLFFSLFGILYVWFLPLLADIGFAEKGSTSISAFIANPPATGAMAFISFLPLVLMWEYQDYIISRDKVHYKICKYSLSLFQFFYGVFLTCTYGYAPDWLHSTSVGLFGCFMIIHYSLILMFIEFWRITQIVLATGIISFFGLIFVEGMWFWAFECISFSAMLSFTALEWFFLKPERQEGLLNLQGESL